MARELSISLKKESNIGCCTVLDESSSDCVSVKVDLKDPQSCQEFTSVIGSELLFWLEQEQSIAESDPPTDQKNADEWANAEMVDVTVYCDSSGLFSEEECEQDNLCELAFPLVLLREYYDQNRQAYENEQIAHLKCRPEECSFEAWLEDAYTADSTDALCDYARQRQFYPKRQK